MTGDALVALRAPGKVLRTLATLALTGCYPLATPALYT